MGLRSRATTQNAAGQVKTQHYGGSIKSNGKLSNSPTGHKHFNAHKRHELIARLENAMLPRTAIAGMVGMSVNRLNHIMKSAAYLNTRLAITHGIIVDFDSRLADIKEQRREILTSFLPPALQILANEISRVPQNLAERKHQTAVAQDMLDREGSLAKISKTEIKPVDFFDFEHADRVSSVTIQAIRGTVQQTTEGVSEAMEISKKFSNSHTLDVGEQQEALKVLERLAAENPELARAASVNMTSDVN
jgi:hypothetical protein